MTTLQLLNVRQMCRTGEAREIRIKSGLSLAELAKDVHRNKTTVHNWETGKTQPRGDAAIVYGERLLQLRRLLSRMG
ncbi:helix-turn-helix transcriptional regulator [Microbacterium capsulatum]|uniref:Helix-turn-helix transcriptional regulator n=1 Tax=Microbacterium capsulatum TaxID=3041921 RepID=A0ABU0XI14_9MICO|nr:helix-turn-helix transcriptional regulator [Microbacterium sp. ASV81]MDQ4213780.1 helix-turn-helix transcriptional regulator [Microbacterium sp. ASV81]